MDILNLDKYILDIIDKYRPLSDIINDVLPSNPFLIQIIDSYTRKNDIILYYLGRILDRQFEITYRKKFNVYTITFYFGWDKKTSSIKINNNVHISEMGILSINRNITLDDIGDIGYDVNDILITGSNYKPNKINYQKKIK